MEHYHIVAVCRDHGAEELRVVSTPSDVSNFLQDAESFLQEVFDDVTPGESTTNTREFVVWQNNAEHEIFISWGRHSGGDLYECQAVMEARAVAKQLEIALHEAYDEVMGKNRPKTEEEPLNSSQLFGSIEDFLRGNQPGAN